jgi:hypothetical protein
MAANTTPIFANQPAVSWVNLIAATTSNIDLTTGYGLAFTADATDGSFISKLIIQPMGTSATAATFPAGVLKIFINNGSTVSTQANNTLIRETILPVFTNGLDCDSTTLIVPSYEVILNYQLPAGYRVYVGYTGALSSAICINVTAFGSGY